jgi:UDP-glucose 4-epimerase
VGEQAIEMRYTGIRPGEKVHEVLVSEEESPRTTVQGEHLVIAPILPELRVPHGGEPFAGREFSSADEVVQGTELQALLTRHRVTGGENAVGADRER